MKASELKSGDKVMYLDEFPAEVTGVRSNGVLIGFWGRGLQLDKWVVRRVPAKTLSPRPAK